MQIASMFLYVVYDTYVLSLSIHVFGMFHAIYLCQHPIGVIPSFVIDLAPRAIVGTFAVCHEIQLYALHP